MWKNIFLIIISGAVLGPILIAVVQKGSSKKQRLLLGGAALYELLSLLFLYLNLIDVTTTAGRALYAVKLLVDIFIFIFIISVHNPAAIRSRLNSACYLLCATWTVVASGLLIIETGVRAVPIVSTLDINPGVRYFWPDWVNYPLNKFGHRDREFVIPKEPKTYRILLLGDSFTEGAGLSRDQTFGRKLESRLNKYLAGAGFVDVYNLGHCGWNTQEEIALLHKQGTALAPDLVILNYVFNDAETHPLTVPYYVEPVWGKRLSELFLHRHGSYAYYLVQSTLELFPKNFRDVHALYESQHLEDQIGWINVKQALEQYKQWLSSQQVDGISVIWPMFTAAWKNDPATDRLHHQVASEFIKLDIPVIDLQKTSAFAEADYRKLSISAFDSHPNEKANELVSGLLFDAILSANSFKNFQKQLN